MANAHLLRSQRRLQSLLAQWDEWLASPATARQHAPTISGWSVTQHADHLTQADALILPRLERALADRPDGPRRRITLGGRIVLWTGYIPRGAGKAPPPTRAAAEPDPAVVRSRLARERDQVARLGEQLDLLAALPTGLDHPYFGRLDGGQWLRFLEIHHHHHAKIVREILAHPA